MRQPARPVRSRRSAPAVLAVALGLAVLAGCGGEGSGAPSGDAADAGDAGDAGEAAGANIVSDQVRSGSVTSADGSTIRYAEVGTPEPGEPAVVLIHCWSCDAAFWSSTVDDLAPDYRVVTLDLAGHGESGMERAAWTLESFGEDVKAVVEELGIESAILVGHSMGGIVALEATQRMPDRVAGIVAVDTLQDVDYKWPEEVTQRMLTAAEADFPAYCNNMVRQMYPEMNEPDPAVVDWTVERMCAEPWEHKLALLRAFPGYDQDASARRTGVPVYGINAPTFATDVEGNREAFGDFDASVMMGVGHFPMLEKPEEFAAELRKALDALAAKAGDQPA